MLVDQPVDQTWTPVLAQVVESRQETTDVYTLSLSMPGGPFRFRPGQFNMLTAFGVGEVPISISSPPGPGPVEHTIRDVGPVTHALCQTPIGGLLGVRGPFGTDWGLDAMPVATDSMGRAPVPDVIVVAGGIGLAPLRGAVHQLLADAHDGRRVMVAVGARSPDQIIFARDLDLWADAGADVRVTVDSGDRDWKGHVGVVTSLLGDPSVDVGAAVALVCGPEVMARFAARALLDLGLDSDRIRVSLERNMQCGVGLCGHCQLGPLIICRDGPVVAYSAVVDHLLAERER